ncbi:MAG TPA: response regulator transcription factor [Baekduia sp.]|uniref:response regulator transcription factor n=1 Tax=Baekduia sp. TaxID=2600305 RepID=UPI002D1A00F6|nr:response regulator transcription factor [Baekduia sp.]HMJ32735.1 response regulator transcription factor [Baekduia sp.]
MTDPARVLIADGDASTRTGLRVTLAAAGFSIAGESRDAESAVVAALAERPELLVLAADLPGGGMEASRKVAALLPGTRIVMLSRDPSGEELVAAVQAGASGYLGEDVSQARLPAALRGILAGEVALPRRLTQHLLDELRGRNVRHAVVDAQASSALTTREWEVLELLMEQTSTGDMARRLGISQVTVRRHVSSLLGKLGLSSRAGVGDLVRRRSSE